MADLRVNPQEVEHEEEKREEFRFGVGKHFITYLAVNALIWVIWALIPKAPDTFPWPWVITGGWGVVWLVHAIIVFFSHSPREVAHDEVKREVQEQHLNNPR
jgi:hypothetical protein